MHFSSSLHVHQEEVHRNERGCLHLLQPSQSHMYTSGMITSNLRPGFSSRTLKGVTGASRWQSLSLVKVTVTFWAGRVGQHTHTVALRSTERMVQPHLSCHTEQTTKTVTEALGNAVFILHKVKQPIAGCSQAMEAVPIMFTAVAKGEHRHLPSYLCQH